MERKQKRSITMLVCCQASAIWTEIYILVYSKISKKAFFKRGFFYLLILNLQIPYNMDLSIKMRF
jgi:hypothetical protein